MKNKNLHYNKVDFHPSPHKKPDKLPLFIHIPKAAGSSIREFALPYMAFLSFLHNKEYRWSNIALATAQIMNGNPRYNEKSLHHSHKEISYYEQKLNKKILDQCFIFAFVRNPFDRLVSAHNFLRKGGNQHPEEVELGKSLDPDFKIFVKTQLNEALFQNHLKPMHTFLDGNYDYIGKFENIKEDFDKICSLVGAPKRKLAYVNKSKHKHYTEYYDDETIEIVGDIYSRDLQMYDYKFDE